MRHGPLRLLAAKKKPTPPILPKRAWQVGASGAVCGMLLQRVAIESPPRLFALHVACMAPMLPLGTAAISTVRQRLSKPPTRLPDAAARKRRSEWLIIRHFMTSAAALYVATVGLGSIYLHKQALGRAHLRTVHSWLGASAWALWLASYVAAQPHVWRDQWRARSFSLLRNKRWLWSSPLHRRLGLGAYALSLFAYGSGVLGWKAVPRRGALAASVAVVAVGNTVIGSHGLHELEMMLRDLFRIDSKTKRGAHEAASPATDAPSTLSSDGPATTA